MSLIRLARSPVFTPKKITMNVILNLLDKTPSEFPCQQRQVLSFMRHIPTQEKALVPTIPSIKTLKLRVDLIHEELQELRVASGLVWAWTRVNKCTEASEKVYERFPDPTDDDFEYRKTLVVDPVTSQEGHACVDLKEVADQLCDLLYVVNGAGVAFGLYLPELFQAVHSNNMLKLEKGTIDQVSGKLIKPPDHPKVDLHPLLQTQMEREADTAPDATYPELTYDGNN